MLKYVQLIQDMEARIERGDFKDGHKLPPIRMLSEQYACSKSTVISAYNELERRHLIYSIPKSGYYVVKRDNRSEQQEQPTMIDLASAAPDSSVFPYIDFQHCINKAIDMYQNDLFEYGTPSGLPSLIRVLQKHLANYQVFAEPHQICITSGVQQALAILTTMPFPNQKETVLIEQPSYHLLIQLLETHGIPVIGIERTSQGIDFDELEKLFRTGNIKLFYTMPRFHNPLGTSYSTREKKALAELAGKYDVYIVEDDYLADLEDDSKSDPVYAYDQSSHLIYLKSYSKILFPGLRVGAAVVPHLLADTFNKYKKLQDIDSSMLSQAALEIYIQSGMFERHKQKIQAAYMRRMELLTNALEREGDIDFARLYKGAHTHIAVGKPFSTPALKERLLRQHVKLDSADAHYLSDFPKKSLIKLNISNVKEEYIEQAVILIAGTIRRMRR
ncbi:aminotransferase-like domain-containing protein [Paenibacillus sp. UNC451MF]|uniref:aminotransferase-like domain-containing protein n=1 Tax=Paenibacillus sp. UNC451MF TaxID=1449063 RepID=UPI00048F1290|nr:PLP-dependent aminotransferase family protein [Paenibacillus sp. UNC451MF]